MKIIAIGDIHGRNIWENIIEKETFDKIIFIGDYFDSRDDISAEEQKENFRSILKFKREAPGKAILLFGNHDYHYLSGVKENYSGHQPLHELDIRELIEGALNERLLQMCFLHEDYLFSHAGFTKTWCKDWLGNENPSLNVLENTVNDLLYFQPQVFRFQMPPRGFRPDMTGDNIWQSPIWVRPKSLISDALEEVDQVVGHTQVECIQENTAVTRDIFLIDTLGTSGEYLIIENDHAYAKYII